MSERLNGYSRTALSASIVALFAACAQQPPASPPKNGPAVPTVAPPPTREAEATPPPPPPPPPVTAATQQQSQKLALAAAGMLEAGHEEPARAELQKALIADPNNKLASSLLKQVTADPIAVLGRESFNYTVRPNDSMSAIAGRFLGDIYSFYILARYNNISVPRQVGEGQVLRVPGKAPAPSALREPPAPRVTEPRTVEPPTTTLPGPTTAPAVPAAVAPVPPPPPPPEPTPAERAMRNAQANEKTGNLEQARTDYLAAAKLDQPGAAAKADQLGKQLVLRFSLNARTAFAKQDLDGAIRAWDRVLVVDPANDTAKLERQRALSLKEKAKKL